MNIGPKLQANIHILPTDILRVDDPEELKRVLNKGKLTAEEVSKLTLKRVKDALGFYSDL